MMPKLSLSLIHISFGEFPGMKKPVGGAEMLPGNAQVQRGNVLDAVSYTHLLGFDEIFNLPFRLDVGRNLRGLGHGPVSYTHLDVYKRQVSDDGDGMAVVPL